MRWTEPAPPLPADGIFSIDQIELRGFSRSMAELQWLLVALVVLYYVAPTAPIADPPLFVGATVIYACTVLAHRYFGLFRQESRWTLAIESWLMVGYITWLLWQTGNSNSPLLNLYSLVLIMSGLTLGRTTTLLQLFLLLALYFQCEYRETGELVWSSTMLNELLTRFAPFVLTTYLVMLLASDLRFSRSALQSVTQTDELTGLPTRRAFMETIRREFERSVRHQRSFALVMVDADGLKPTNDNHGHAAGDRLISLIADVLRTTLRGSDACARYGGDEFVALLPDTDGGAALEAAERIRTGVANTSFDFGGHRINCTVSVGFATFPQDAETLDELVTLADRALYRAKHEGRNCVVSASAAATGMTFVPPPQSMKANRTIPGAAAAEATARKVARASAEAARRTAQGGTR